MFFPMQQNQRVAAQRRAGGLDDIPAPVQTDRRLHGTTPTPDPVEKVTAKV